MGVSLGFTVLWALTQENLTLLHMNSKDKDQPSYPCSLTNAFFIHYLENNIKHPNLVQAKFQYSRQDYKTFFMLNSAEQEISTAHKSSSADNKDFSCFKTLRCCFYPASKC